MSLKVMNDNNINILSKEDANHYYTLSGYAKYFISESYGAKFNVTLTGLIAKLGSGQGTVYGRHIINDGESDISCQLPINSEGYLVLSLDLTKPAGSELSFTTKTILNEEDLINKGTKYDIPLYSYITNATTVTRFDDVRKYFDKDISAGKIADKAVTANKIDTSVLLKIYPVGAIYTSVINTNPSILFGGVWTTFGAGRTVVGVDTTQTEFNTVQRTGGAKTHEHGMLNTRNGTLEAAVGSTGSNIGEIGYSASNVNNVGIKRSIYSIGGTSLGSKDFNHWTGIYGATASAANLQPYITVYMWRRTA